MEIDSVRQLQNQYVFRILLATRNPIGVGIAIGIERSDMGFGHEKLNGYFAVIEYIGWAFRLCEGIKRHRNTKGFDSDTEGKPQIYSELQQGCGSCARIRRLDAGEYTWKAETPALLLLPPYFRCLIGIRFRGGLRWNRLFCQSIVDGAQFVELGDIGRRKIRFFMGILRKIE